MKHPFVRRLASAVLLYPLFHTAVARAQTAPVLPGPNTTETTTAGVDSTLLSEAFEVEIEGIVTGAPGETAQLTREKDEVKEGQGALRWSYGLEMAKPATLTFEADRSLEGARTLRAWVRASQPAVIGFLLEAARENGADPPPPQRYIAAVWLHGNGWQPVELSLDRFVLQNAGESTLPAPTLPGWNRISRYGVLDLTNVWLQRAGEPRLTGKRRLWLDDLQITTQVSTLAAVPPATPPTPPADANLEPEEADEPGPDAPGPDTQQPPDGREPPFGQAPPDGQAPPGFEEQNQNRPDGNGDFEPAGQEQDAAPIVEPPLMVHQDPLGNTSLWIPINGQISSDDNGLQWNYSRLANRTTALVAPVNPLWFQTLGQSEVKLDTSTRRDVSKIGKAQKWVKLVLDIRTRKLTRLNVAVTERGGAVYSQTLQVNPSRYTQRVTFLLPRFKNERTRPDNNGQIDLNQVETVTISDVGAQINIAGPNDITLRSATWMY
jgi:hypothetical protein